MAIAAMALSPSEVRAAELAPNTMTVLVSNGAMAVVDANGSTFDNPFTIDPGPENTITVATAFVGRPTHKLIAGPGCEITLTFRFGLEPVAYCHGVTRGIIVFGGDGRDEILLNNIDQPITVYGGTGNDNLAASFVGPHATVALYGEGDNDTATVLGTTSNVRIEGGDGNDEVTSQTPGALILGGAGDDNLQAVNGGREWFDGGPGNDVLRGGPSTDVLIGGSGRDKLFGGGGADIVDARDTPNARDVRIECGGGRDTVFFDPADAGLPNECEVRQK